MFYEHENFNWHVKIYIYDVIKILFADWSIKISIVTYRKGQKKNQSLFEHIWGL